MSLNPSNNQVEELSEEAENVQLHGEWETVRDSELTLLCEKNEYDNHVQAFASKLLYASSTYGIPGDAIDYLMESFKEISISSTKNCVEKVQEVFNIDSDVYFGVYLSLLCIAEKQ